MRIKFDLANEIYKAVSCGPWEFADYTVVAEDRLTRSTYDQWLEFDIQHPFDWVQIATTDATRISGMQVNGKVWDAIPDAETRANKGTYLKPGKLIRALFSKVDFNPDVQAAAGALARALGSCDTEKIKVSDDVGEIYNMDHHGSGTVGSSCMRNKHEDYFELYHDAGAKVAYLEEDDILMARAILWPDAEIDGQPGKFMDRIYTSNENQEAAFISWAKKHGYFYKDVQSSGCSRTISPDGETEACDIQVKLDRHEYEAVPYLDTLQYWGGGWLHTGRQRVETTLTGVDGTDEDGVLTEYNGALCEDCGSRVDEEDALRVDGHGFVCDYCAGNYICCDHCGEYDSFEDVVTDGHGAKICDSCMEHYFICEDCGSIIEHSDSAAVVNAINGNGVDLCLNCRDENWTQCDECENFIRDDSGDIEHRDGRDLCPDCLAEAIDLEKKEEARADEKTTATA